MQQICRDKPKLDKFNLHDTGGPYSPLRVCNLDEKRTRQRHARKVDQYHQTVDKSSIGMEVEDKDHILHIATGHDYGENIAQLHDTVHLPLGKYQNRPKDKEKNDHTAHGMCQSFGYQHTKSILTRTLAPRGLRQGFCQALHKRTSGSLFSSAKLRIIKLWQCLFSYKKCLKRTKIFSEKATYLSH